MGGRGDESERCVSVAGLVCAGIPLCRSDQSHRCLIADSRSPGSPVAASKCEEIQLGPRLFEQNRRVFAGFTFRAAVWYERSQTFFGCSRKVGLQCPLFVFWG